LQLLFYEYLRFFSSRALLLAITVIFFILIPGSGVQCDTGAHGIVLVGNRALMEEQQVHFLDFSFCYDCSSLAGGL